MQKRLEFKWDTEEQFKHDFCKFCKNRNVCPIDYKCSDFKTFMEMNDVRNGNRTKKVR